MTMALSHNSHSLSLSRSILFIFWENTLFLLLMFTFLLSLLFWLLTHLHTLIDINASCRSAITINTCILHFIVHICLWQVCILCAIAYWWESCVESTWPHHINDTTIINNITSINCRCCFWYQQMHNMNFEYRNSFYRSVNALLCNFAFHTSAAWVRREQCLFRTHTHTHMEVESLSFTKSKEFYIIFNWVLSIRLSFIWLILLFKFIP